MQNFSIFLHIFFCFFIVIYLFCLFISDVFFFSYFCYAESLFPFFNIAPDTFFFIIGIATHKTTSIHQKYRFQVVVVQFPFHLIKHCLPFQLVIFLTFHSLLCAIRVVFGVLLLSVLCFPHEQDQIVSYHLHNYLVMQLFEISFQNIYSH